MIAEAGSRESPRAPTPSVKPAPGVSGAWPANFLCVMFVCIMCMLFVCLFACLHGQRWTSSHGLVYIKHQRDLLERASWFCARITQPAQQVGCRSLALEIQRPPVHRPLLDPPRLRRPAMPSGRAPFATVSRLAAARPVPGEPRYDMLGCFNKGTT